MIFGNWSFVIGLCGYPEFSATRPSLFINLATRGKFGQRKNYYDNLSLYFIPFFQFDIMLGSGDKGKRFPRWTKSQLFGAFKIPEVVFK